MLELGNLLQEDCVLFASPDSELFSPVVASIHSKGVLLRGTWKKIQDIAKSCVLSDFGEIRLQWQLTCFSLMTHPLGQDLTCTLNTAVSSTSECTQYPAV